MVKSLRALFLSIFYLVLNSIELSERKLTHATLSKSKCFIRCCGINVVSKKELLVCGIGMKYKKCELYNRIFLKNCIALVQQCYISHVYLFVA